VAYRHFQGVNFLGSGPFLVEITKHRLGSTRSGKDSGEKQNDKCPLHYQYFLTATGRNPIYQYSIGKI
jgi:hypothetical protein